MYLCQCSCGSSTSVDGSGCKWRRNKDKFFVCSFVFLKTTVYCLCSVLRDRHSHVESRKMSHLRGHGKVGLLMFLAMVVRSREECGMVHSHGGRVSWGSK